jgi:hypothetical protein
MVRVAPPRSRVPSVAGVLSVPLPVMRTWRKVEVEPLADGFLFHP